MFKKAKYNSLISYNSMARYFEEMASKGKIISVVEKDYHYFVKAPKQDLKFKVIIIDKNKINKDELIEESKKKGWRFVSRNRYLMIFCKNKNSISENIINDSALEYEMIKNSFRKNELHVFIVSFLAIIYSVFRMFVINEISIASIIKDLPLILLAISYIVKVTIWFYKNQINIEIKDKLFNYSKEVETLINGFMMTMFISWLTVNGYFLLKTQNNISITHIYVMILLSVPVLLLVWYYNHFMFKKDKSLLMKICAFLIILIIFGLLLFFPLAFRLF